MAYNGTPFPERFWLKVQKSGTCWLWTAGKFDDGYGACYYQSKQQPAHRVAWKLTFGDGSIPKGLFLCHTCDVKACVRPEHLFIGTAKDNSQDLVNKGLHAYGDQHWTRHKPERLARGERQGLAKLTARKVRRIRVLKSQGATNRGLGRQFGVTGYTIYCIINRVTWKHI